MSETKHLDVELRKILTEWFGDVEGVGQQVITDIMNAVKNDGYLKGGEFYKRFDNFINLIEYEYRGGSYPNGPIWQEAAKRAAGMQ